MNRLIEQFKPRLIFTRNEPCFPISADLYLKHCTINYASNNDTRIDFKDPLKELHNYMYNIYEDASSRELYRCYKNNIKVQLAFKDDEWKEELKGQPYPASGYVRVIEEHNRTLLIFFYLFSHVEAYKLFGCLCPLNRWAHKADVKFLLSQS